MFLGFFSLLRSYGLKVSTQEWMTLMQALEMNLGESTLTGFYHLCRSILVKSEADYDTLDRVFALYFQNVKDFEDLPEDVWKWLENGEIERALSDIPNIDFDDISIAELLKQFQERLEEQNEEHHGGNRWIGTGGTSPFGRGGYNPAGIRIGGHSRHRSAVKVAGDRRFVDFREDHQLDSRDFQIAFRRLRQYSSRVDSARTELDVEGTVKATGDNAGLLSLVYEKPRKNTVKVLLLIDSDGSMRRHSDLVNKLFQSLRKSNHFKDLQVYYFHNCIYDHLYKNPTCEYGDWVDTSWVMQKYDSEYKVIIVGDGAMAPYELVSVGGINDMRLYNSEPGIEWLRKIKRKFKKHIWLNPIAKSKWNYAWGSYTISILRDEFEMFELSLDGLEQGIKKLLVK